MTNQDCTDSFRLSKGYKYKSRDDFNARHLSHGVCHERTAAMNALLLQAQQEPRNNRQRIEPDNITDKEFKKHFRFSKLNVQRIADLPPPPEYFAIFDQIGGGGKCNS